MPDLRRYLGVSGSTMRKLVEDCGIVLRPVKLHYTDDRPRATSIRHHQPFTLDEIKQIIKLYRYRQGKRLVK